jgi:hypothetical protein
MTIVIKTAIREAFEKAGYPILFKNNSGVSTPKRMWRFNGSYKTFMFLKSREFIV